MSRLEITNLPLLVLGTRNEKKRRELAELLEPLGFQLQTLEQYPDALDVVEDGDSFAANARLKAVEQAKHLGRWVLGEDSGLVVDALGGAPGIYSARFSGPHATDEQNNRRLLEELGKTPLERRTAHYVCHMTLSDPQGQVRAESEESCRGRIRFAPAGSGGFGYDPLFEIPEYHRTFGELGPAVKAALSHRGRAMRRLVPQLRALVQTP
jgi:XTP/dITP diphosphohydrolase